MYPKQNKEACHEKTKHFKGIRGSLYCFYVYLTAKGETIFNITFITEYDSESGGWMPASEYVVQAKFEVFGDAMTLIIDLEPDVDGGGVFDDSYPLADEFPYNPEYDFLATLYRQ